MSEFLWRKQILPFGVIPWRDTELECTSLSFDLAASFAEHPLDLVPFILSTDGGYDLTLCLGEVRALEVVSDGLDALVAVGREGDDLITADRALPVAAGIIKQYKAADGQEFAAVLRHLTATPSVTPALQRLRSWKREAA